MAYAYIIVNMKYLYMSRYCCLSFSLTGLYRTGTATRFCENMICNII